MDGERSVAGSAGVAERRLRRPNTARGERMIAIVLATAAGTGAYLLFTAIALGRRSVFGHITTSISRSQREQFDDWLVQAGLSDVNRKHLIAFAGGLFVAAGLLGWTLFGGVLAPLMIGVFAATFPAASYRQRRRHRRSEAAETWPRMIEEIRLLCGSLGRPIPQALIEVGKQGPVEFRGAFIEAEREWLMSTDFARTVSVVKESLA